MTRENIVRFTVSCPEKLLREFDEAIKDEYGTRSGAFQEFMRECVRKLTAQLKEA